MKGVASIGATVVFTGSGLIHPRAVLAARAENAFEAKSVKDALVGLFGQDATEETDRISMKLPDIAENGSVVPVVVSTDLTNVESISVLAAKNETPLVASFKLGPKADGFVGTRIKMAKTADVIAVVKANGKLYSAKREVKVTIGGCGG